MLLSEAQAAFNDRQKRGLETLIRLIGRSIESARLSFTMWCRWRINNDGRACLASSRHHGGLVNDRFWSWHGEPGTAYFGSRPAIGIAALNDGY